MDNLILYLSYKINDKGIMVAGLQGYTYAEEIEKNRNGMSGFLNTDIGYVPTSHEVNYTYKLIAILEFIEMHTVIKLNDIDKFLTNLKDKFKEYNLTIITEHSDLEEICKKIDIGFLVSESLIFNIGLDISSKLMLMAINKYKQGITDFEDIRKLPNSKYWKPTVTKHPFVNFKQILTITNEHTKGKYAILKYDTENEIGRKLYSAAYGLAILKEPIEDIEFFITKLTKFFKTDNKLVTVNIRTLYNANSYFYFNKYKDDAIEIVEEYNKPTLLTLLDNVSEPLAMNIHPVGLGFHAMDNITILDNLIKTYETNRDSKNIDFIDITDLLYDDTEKGKKFKTALTNNDSIYHTYKKDGVKPHKIALKLNVDLIERNNLKNIEKENPSVFLVVINHNNIKIEYYTLIDCKDTGNKFIWCSFYTNVIFLKESK